MDSSIKHFFSTITEKKAHGIRVVKMLFVYLHTTITIIKTTNIRNIVKKSELYKRYKTGTLSTWLSYTVGVVVYYALFQSFYNLVADKTLWPYPTSRHFAISLLHNFIPVLITIIGTWFIIFKGVKSRHTIWKLTADVFLSTLLLGIINLVYWLIVPTSSIDWAGTAFNSIFVLLIIETLYYVKSFLFSLREAERQRALALQYQYDALKAQVNPHFLFNSLNILYSLVSIDQKKSKEFIMALSKTYRYILAQQGKQTIPLTKELEFLYDYVEVLMMRYHNQFDVEVTGETNIGEDICIVPYTLQLLLENITKHNIISNRHHMRVTIDIGQKALTISNPIVPRNTESSTGIGLSYISRLYSRHNRKFMIENDGHTFRAVVPYL